MLERLAQNSDLKARVTSREEAFSDVNMAFTKNRLSKKATQEKHDRAEKLRAVQKLKERAKRKIEQEKKAKKRNKQSPSEEAMQAALVQAVGIQPKPSRKDWVFDAVTGKRKRSREIERESQRRRRNLGRH